MSGDFFQFIGENWLLVTALLTCVTLLVLHESSKGAKGLSTQQLTNAVNQQNAVVVDIRSREDFQEGHITDAINIPSAELADQLSQLEKHKNNPIILVCGMGHATGSAAKTLEENGFLDVSKLLGGMAEWRASKLPVVQK